MSRIDRRKRLISRKGFRFKPFRPTDDHQIPLASLKMDDDVELLTFARNGQHRAILVTQAIYHHLIQGELAGQPYLVSY